MKVAALTPRTISFTNVKTQPISARSPVCIKSAGQEQAQREARPLHLTHRELEVLSLLCEGMPNKLIGRRLNISAGTVKIHVGKILSGLGAASRLQAVVIAHRQGLLEESDVSRDNPGYDAMPEKHLQRPQLHSVPAA